jgi:hypothetical protein
MNININKYIRAEAWYKGFKLRGLVDIREKVRVQLM